MVLKGVSIDFTKGKNLQSVILTGNNLSLNEQVQLTKLNFSVNVNKSMEFIQVLYIPQFDDKQAIPFIQELFAKLKNMGVQIFRDNKYFIKIITDKGEKYLSNDME